MKPNLHALLIEDNINDVKLLARELSRHYELSLDHVQTEEQYRTALSLRRPDIILSDFSLPVFDGLQALSIRQAIAPEIPFILVTGSINETTAVRCMKAGADDYIIKEHLHRLAPAVDAAREKQRMLNDKRSMETALRMSEERFRRALDNSPVTVFNQDLELRYTWIYHPNPHFDITAVVGKSDHEFLPPREAERLTEIKRRAIRGRETVRDTVQTTIAGEPFHYDLTVEPVFDREGNVSGITCVSVDITAQTIARNALVASEQRFRSIFQDNLAVMLLIDPATRKIVDANDAALAYYGWDRSRMLTMTLEELNTIPVEEIRQQIEKALQHQRNYFEFLHRRADGSVRHVEAFTSVITFGTATYLHSIIHDVTERKQAEAGLKLHSAALRSAANAIVITATDGTIVSVNPAFTAMTGYEADEVIGKKPSVLKSGMQNDAFYASMWETILAGRTWHGALTNKRKDGTIYPEEMTVNPVIDDQGRPSHFIAIKHDITERQRFMEQLAEQALLLDEAHDAIILRDMEHRVRYWNKGAERMFEYTREEAVGQDLRSMLYPAHDAYAKELVQLRTTGSYSGEFQLHTRQHRTVIADVRLNLIFDKTGNATAILEIANDITEKKSIEHQLLRTQRLGSLGTLAGGIAHDLNNVLGPILLAVDYLKRMNTNEQALAMLGSMESSARRGAEIVKQILGFARGVGGQKIPLQVRHLIKEITTIFTETFPRSISVTTDLPAAIWNIVADPTQIHQVIMNLGVNARDAMPEGGMLTIAASNELIDEQFVRMNIEAHEGRYVRIAVHDTGIGIPAGIQDQIFDPFFTTKEIGKGTGLGLSTVYTIVKNHGGFVTVQSTVGKGTTVNVYLPATESEEQTAAAVTDRSALTGNNELILVVDDERSVRDVTLKTLEHYRYRVILATDGADAVALYLKHRGEIVLVMTDINMPVMDGKQLIVTLRKIDPALKIIISSGLIDHATGMQGVSSGIAAVLEKPYTAEQLITTVAHVLRADGA